MGKHDKNEKIENIENATKTKNVGKKEKRKFKFVFKIAIVIVFLALIVAILYLASHNYIRDDITDKINLIINNGNVTTSLKKDIYVQDGIIYLSQADIDNFFDHSVIYDEKYDQIITCSEKKVAVLPIGKNQIQVNSSNTTIKGGAIQKEGTYYLPISELGDVYNIQTTYLAQNNVVTINSLDRECSIATIAKNSSIKYKPTFFSRTVAKVEEGESVTIANRSEYPVPEGWTRVRTEDGILGYIQTNKMGAINQIRETIEMKPKIKGTVSLAWDYFSQYYTAPDRNGTTIEGINVVSPTFFRLEQAGKGNILANVGEEGESYVSWAHKQNYQVWPMLSNESLNDTTSEILRDYKLRESLINQIVQYIIKYDLDGINIDFENMYEADKDYFSRFLIELEPRLNEIGAVLSVDVTAPDGAPNWSMCYDRYTIGKVADFIIFMGYDQYGISSTEAGTTAGCDWVEANITKFLGQEGVPAEKLILGMPFYTRFWEEKDGKLISKDTVNMNKIDNVIPNNVEKQWDENLKQYYIEYKENDVTCKMWIEDETSFKAKLNLVTEYHLAGAAYWTKGMEKDSIWKVVSETLGI